MHVNTSTKFQFKSIDVDTGKVQFRDPYTYNPYDQLVPRKDIVKAWNAECQLREAEIITYDNEIHNSRDELVQAPEPDSGA